jgi:hypothetical protein
LTKGPLICAEMKAVTLEVVKSVQREVYFKELDSLKEENMQQEEVLKSRKKYLPLPSLIFFDICDFLAKWDHNRAHDGRCQTLDPCLCQIMLTTFLDCEAWSEK